MPSTTNSSLASSFVQPNVLELIALIDDEFRLRQERPSLQQSQERWTPYLAFQCPTFGRAFAVFFVGTALADA